MRKIALLIMIFIFSACLFTMTSFAVTGSTSNEFGKITYVDGLRSDTQIKDQTSRVVLLNSDGTYSTYPTYYICDVKLQWQGTTQYKFDAINAALGTNYDMMSIVRIEIITDATIWNPHGGVLHGNTNLLEVIFPEGTQMTEIGGQTFKGCTNLKSITIPKSVKTLGWLCFEHCYGLEEVIFEEGSQLTKLGGPTFQRCDSLKEIKFPDSLTSASGLILQSCGSLEKVFFGRNFTGALSSNAFQSTPTKGLQIFVPENADFASIMAAAKNATIVTTLTKEQAEKTGVGKVYSYDELLSAGKFEENAIVYGCPGCMMFSDGGSHKLENINTCVGKCAVCGYIDKLEAPRHILNTFCTYENGFSKSGIAYESCTNEGCGHLRTVETVNALIGFIGYSVKEDKSAVCVSYYVNKIAIDAYTSYNEDEQITYGIYFGISNGNTDNLLSYNNGVIEATNEKSVNINLESNIVGFDFKVSGFNEGTLNTDLMIFAYIGNGSKIEYVTEDTEVNSIKISQL